jgi:phosphoglycerate dehydrogenase-like enzyme
MSPEREQKTKQQLEQHGFATEVLNPEQLLDVLPRIELLVLGRPPRIDWSAAARLRLIHVAGSGVDPLLPARGLRPEVTITNSRGAHAELVRDHAIASLLALFREFPRAHAQQARREWRSYPTQSVAGKRLCIVGLGEIGARIAAVAHALGMRVSGVCRTPREVPGTELVVGIPQLVEVLSTADAVVLCVPLTSQTRGLFNAEVLAALPTGARLVNVSRGAVVDEAALEVALRAGRLTAALDVFEAEPLPSTSSLWDCPGLLVTPHIAGFATDYMDGVIAAFVAATLALEAGELPPTVVSREYQY